MNLISISAYPMGKTFGAAARIPGIPGNSCGNALTPATGLSGGFPGFELRVSAQASNYSLLHLGTLKM